MTGKYVTALRERSKVKLFMVYSQLLYIQYLCVCISRGKTKNISQGFTVFDSQGSRDKEFLFSLSLTIQNFYSKIL